MIPEFLKRENFTETKDELLLLCQQYDSHFEEDINLSWRDFSREQWIKAIKKCLRKNKRFEELYYVEEEYEEGVDY